MSTTKKGNDNENAKTGKKIQNVNRETTFITYFFLILFLGLMAYYIYFQQVKSEEFINSPYNTLQDLFAEHVTRGSIVSADGEVIAQTTTDSEGNEVREYPYGRLFSHVVGYNSNGKAGLEKQMNFELLRSHEHILTQIVNDIRDQKNPGDSVITNLNYKLQSVAYDALGDYDGAVIAMDPDTGKILCMVSKPDYNPNTIAQEWDEIRQDSESSVLVNRATQGKYAPGSVFKIFTLLEYYRENKDDYEDYRFDCDSTFTFDDRTIHCAGNKSHGEEDLKKAFAKSCNAAFAGISLDLNLDSFGKMCNNMLFNRDLSIGLESSRSSFSLTEEDSSYMIMETGIGQGKTLVSPLHMMLVSSAIANDGILMRPYLVDYTKSANGTVVESYEPEEYATLMSGTEAEFLSEYMRSVVTDGTGTKLSDASYEAYGKTGTAQVSDSTDQTNAWFTGFAKQGDQSIAIAVIVENSGAGSTYAVPIAKKVFDCYFG